MTNRRRVHVPGVPVEVSVLIVDAAKNAVLSLAHGGQIIVVFTSTVGKPTARVMSEDEAREFTAGITNAFTALTDDAKIREMEKEFDD